MPRLRLSSLARRDLEAIQDHGVAEFGVFATRRYMAGFERVFALLRKYPRTGQSRPEYGDAIRALPHPPYRVLYRLDGDDVLILRILHASRRAADLGELH